MPIIEVNQAHEVIVIKRSLSPGFAGIDNDLFYRDNTSMLFSDAKQAAAEIAAEVAGALSAGQTSRVQASLAALRRRTSGPT